jgi:hypothetical protein
MSGKRGHELEPHTFAFSANTTLVENTEFGQAQSADSDRVVEFLARLRF